MLAPRPDHFAYLDHAASTPMHPEAVEAMLPFLSDRYANPSGAHAMARDARRAVDEARDTVAECLGCEPGEVVFTGSGTEADNLAITGLLARTGGTAVCTAVEHHAVLHPVEHSGGKTLAVDARGVVDMAALADALNPDVRVVSVMLVNNEVGTIQPLDEVAAVVAECAPGAALHTDAVQAVTWLDIQSAATPAAMVSIAGHKFGGPKGVG
ncbi:MAG TPA: aminotransferase class V-fold PLP-dependent enzyme, partial [Acidimicrobiales bacterium]